MDNVQIISNLISCFAVCHACRPSSPLGFGGYRRTGMSGTLFPDTV